MAIDVGASCIARTSGIFTAYTVASYVNPANETGTIDYICIYSHSRIYLPFEVASFETWGEPTGGKGYFTTHDYVTLAAQPSSGKTEYEAPGDFTAFDIDSGEYIGFYNSVGALQSNVGGTGFQGCFYLSGDYIPAYRNTFTETTWISSIYGTGMGLGWAGEIWGVTPAEIWGITAANIAEVMGAS